MLVLRSVKMILHNVKMIPSNTIKCEEKNKGTTEYVESIVIYDVSTTQCENDTIECEKKYVNHCI